MSSEEVLRQSAVQTPFEYVTLSDEVNKKLPIDDASGKIRNLFVESSSIYFEDGGRVVSCRLDRLGLQQSMSQPQSEKECSIQDSTSWNSQRFVSAKSFLGHVSSLKRSPQIASVPVEDSTTIQTSLSECSQRMTTALDDNGRDAGIADFATKLGALPIGFLFADRYAIEEEKIPGKPHCRYALDNTTGTQVFLKFYPQAAQDFYNAVKIHTALGRGNEHVCKMIDCVENVRGYPPCLVLEKGQYTLADRLRNIQLSFVEQRAILYSILEDLKALHEIDVIHGNLDPGNIVWFDSDFSWKLVDLDHASLIGEPVAIPAAGRYSPPEISQARRHGKDRICIQSSADTWSFGVIAFEILTCSSVTESCGVQEYLDRQLDTAPHKIGCCPGRDLSTVRRERIKRDMEDQKLRFVQACLFTEPTNRVSVTEALKDGIFSSARDSYQRAESHPALRINPAIYDLSSEYREMALVHLVCEHMTLSVKVECFTKDSNPADAFFEREAKETLRFFDDYLPDIPVHMLKLEHSFRLRICVSHDKEMHIPIERIAAVSVKPPDTEGEDGESLQVAQWREDTSRVALALLDPAQFTSPRLHVISPHFGLVETKYVKLLVHVKALLGEGFQREIDLYDYVYVKIIHPKNRLIFHRLVGMFENDDTSPRNE